MSVRIELADGGVAPSAIYPWSVSGTVNVGDVVALDASAAKTVLRADADNASARPPIGVCIARSGSLAQVALNGEIASGLSGLTRGTAYWLSTSAGQLVSTKPGSNAYAVGVAVSATELLVDGCLAVLDGSGGGGVNSVGVTSSDSSLTVSNSPITGSGNVGLALNTVGVAKGGTGLTSASEQGAMLYASSSSAYVMQSVSPTFKNRIINGGMTIDQRNNGASVVQASGVSIPYYLDRYRFDKSLSIATTVAQSSDAPSGFSKSLSVSWTTGTVVGASQLYEIAQHVEANNVSDFAWGTASAKTVTFSFWVKSTLAGTYAIDVLAYPSPYQTYTTTYTVSSPNTWEKKSVTIAGPTGGTWNSGANVSFLIRFVLGAGSSLWNSSLNSWNAGAKEGASGMANLLGQNNGQFQVTGVQLEVGSVATAFELRPEQVELALCQRYFQRIAADSSGPYAAFGGGVITSATSALIYSKYPVNMRALPTLSITTPIDVHAQGAWRLVQTLGTVYYGDSSVSAFYNTLTGWTSGRAAILMSSASATAGINLSAEL